MHGSQFEYEPLPIDDAALVIFADRHWKIVLEVGSVSPALDSRRFRQRDPDRMLYDRRVEARCVLLVEF